VKPVRTARLPLEGPRPGSLRHQVTVSDSDYVDLRAAPTTLLPQLARLLGFRYGYTPTPDALRRATAAGGEVLYAPEAGVVATVPAADAVRLLGSTHGSLQNLGGVVALVGIAVPRSDTDLLADETGLRFRWFGLDDPLDEDARRRETERIAEAVKGVYYGYADTPEARTVFDHLAARVDEDASRFLKLVNGLCLTHTGERVTLFAPDRFPTGRGVPEALAAIARNLAHDRLDYRLRKRGFAETGEWGFFEGESVSPVATARLYSRVV
jgi:hypothetical protein